jgi:G:T-mismatch repair DNA endonuclease (very short patch repair protein)
MKIKTNKGVKDVNEVFPDLESFKDYVLKLDKNIRYENEVIKEEIRSLMFKLKEQEGYISLSLMRGWLVKNYSFKTKKWSTLSYFLERGWDEYNASVEIKRRNDELKQRNRLCVEYWLNKGFSTEEAELEISKQQQKSSKCVKIRHGKSKKMLIEKGYNEEEIYRICLTPTKTEFWVNKGYTEDESNMIISKNQIEAAKKVDFKKRLLPSNLEYWMNRGYDEEESKMKVSEHQSTFSLKKCIQKYGKKDGKIRFTERQNKWMNSLLSNGNMVFGYSKISQELFYELLKIYNINDRKEVYFATHNKEFRLKKDEGGFWLYDFTDLKKKKIIEFHGDMFHGNPNKFKSDDRPHPFRKTITSEEIWNKDKRKIDAAVKEGFNVLVIWDSEYRWGDKQKIIDKCITFLNKK